MLRRVPVRSLAVLAVTLTATGAVVWWVRSLGGPVGFREAFGVAALAVTVPAHVLTSLTPLGEVIPFGAANGALYGLWLGAGLNWLAWMVAASLQYAFGKTAAAEVGERTGPAWLRRLPIGHPAVLACGRWLPAGSPLVDAAAGGAGVPFRRVIGWAAVGHAPQAVVIAGVGAGLVALG